MFSPNFSFAWWSCFLCLTPLLASADIAPAQWAVESEPVLFAGMVPSDDEDVWNYLDGIGAPSGDYDIDLDVTQTDEVTAGGAAAAEYDDGADYDEDPFVVPKSVLALLYDGSWPPEKSWPDSFDTENGNKGKTKWANVATAGGHLSKEESTTTFLETTVFPPSPQASTSVATSVTAKDGGKSARFNYNIYASSLSWSDPLYSVATRQQTADSNTEDGKRAPGNVTLHPGAVNMEMSGLGKVFATTVAVGIESNAVGDARTEVNPNPTGVAGAVQASNTESYLLEPTVLSGTDGSAVLSNGVGFSSHEYTNFASSLGSEVDFFERTPPAGAGEFLASTHDLEKSEASSVFEGASVDNKVEDQVEIGSGSDSLTAGANSQASTRVPDSAGGQNIRTIGHGNFASVKPTGSIDGEFFFDDVTTLSKLDGDQPNLSRLEEFSVTSAVPHAMQKSDGANSKSPTKLNVHVSHDYQNDSELGTAFADDDEEDLAPEGRSYHHEKTKHFNRCMVSPFPCRLGEGCHWERGRVVCRPVRSPTLFPQCNPNPCHNGGLCRLDSGSFRCECPAGFSGHLCHISSPCSPNPCRGDCQCIESCRHEMGYFCKSEGGFTGKNCTIPLPKLSCEPSRMSVDLPSQLIHEFDREAGNAVIYASPNAISSAQRSPLCKARQVTDGLEVVIGLPFKECGTQADQPRDGNIGQTFRNRIWLDRLGVGFDMPVPLLDFECVYQKQYRLVTSLNPIVPSPPVRTNSGRFSAEVELCKVSACPSECPRQHVIKHGAVYTVGELIHIGVSSLSQPSGYVMSVENLAISCDPKLESNSALRVISNGCDQLGGIFARSQIGARACVSFQTPRFLGCSTIYFHIHVKRCQSHRTKVCPSGIQTCAPHFKKKKRSVVTEGILTVVGPVLLLNGSRGEGSLQLFPHANNETSTATSDTSSRGLRQQAQPDKDEVLDARPAVYSLIAIGIFIASTFVLLVVAVKYSLYASTRRTLSVENRT